jgi:hypothetical protein
MAAIVIAIIASFFLRETGRRHALRLKAEPTLGPSADS